jgi:GWxTD domain-containing protein
MMPQAGWAEWSGRLWPALANHLWQATLFAGVAFAAASLLRRAPARARHTIWLIALAKFGLPSVVFVEAARATANWLVLARNPVTISPVVSRFAQPVMAPGETTSEGSGHSELGCLLTLAWLGGCGVTMALRWRRRQRFSRALRAGRPVWEGREFEALERARSRLGFDRHVPLILTRELPDPGVTGTLNPVVVWPEGVARQLSDAELEATMVHELLHVRNRDNLAAGFQTLVCSLFWFHPLVWWIDRRLLAERERACDEQALEALEGSESYLAGIVKVCRLAVGASVAGVSGMAGANLKKRMEWIMSKHVRAGSGWFRRLVLGATSAALLLSSLVAGSPQNGVPGGVKGGVNRGVEGGVPGGVAAQLPTPYAKWLAEDVAYIISEPERAAFLRLTTDQEREHFIEQFWLRRDPTPGTAQNEAKEEHYRRIGYANQRFGTSQLPGWKTPRGRIYIIYGPADEIESHYAQNNERWRYLSGPLADVILEFRLP